MCHARYWTNDSSDSARSRIKFSAWLPSNLAPERPTSFATVDRHPQLVRIRARGHAVSDRSGDRGDGQRVDPRDIRGRKLASMRAVQLPTGRAGMVVPRNRQMDPRRIHVCQTVQNERRLVGHHAATHRPRDRRGQFVMFAAR